MLETRREYRAVIVIVILAALIGLYVISTRSALNMEYPDQFLVLADSDFILEYNGHAIQIGQTPGEEVMAVFPEGKMLGISTVFSAGTDKILFTFTEDENIVHKVHIESPNLATSRGSQVGDSFAAVTNAYGDDYAWVNAGNRKDFDAIYGTDNNRCIVFQVRDDKVQRIILQLDPVQLH